ncbi:MAG: DUF3892 domain-containing protein [Sphingobacteriales bacterium]|nr:DUF3892 domain-containing protein [Sphingobacteriales bacterium]MBI3717386.1 DUF3892 domain-containing protein [Sphingobacteriales bacterium]
MSSFKISRVWKNQNNVITHYAFHTIGADSISLAQKFSKALAIVLLETPGNNAVTWIWNYSAASFQNGATGKYLRSNRDNKLTDNLGHLIDFDWIAH